MNLITRAELREKLDRQEEFKLVMTLSAHAYEEKRIPTSLHADCVEDALEVLDPVDEVVVYCGDVRCAASIYAYHSLERAGFTRVRRYAGGIADWEDAGYRLDSGPVEAAEPRRTRSAGKPWWACR
jgi:3-mercaptopyruvate sulfurtransferase SseA